MSIVSERCFFMMNNVSEVQDFITLLQTCQNWSDTIRVQLDNQGQIQIDHSDPELFGCLHITSSKHLTNNISSSKSISVILLSDQLVEALQQFVQQCEQGIIMELTENKTSHKRMKLLNIQHEFITHEVPICDYRKRHQFFKLEDNHKFTSSPMLHVLFPREEWKYIVYTFCIYAGNRGSALEYQIKVNEQGKQENIVEMKVTSESGNEVTQSIRLRPNLDIHVTSLIDSKHSGNGSIHGYLLLHCLLNVVQISSLPGGESGITTQMNEYGMMQTMDLFQRYRVSNFLVNAKDIDEKTYA